MKAERQIDELAKLDGCEGIPCWCGCGRIVHRHPTVYNFDARVYLTSRDAIIPLVEKLIGNNLELIEKFIESLSNMLRIRDALDNTLALGFWLLMKATPVQIAEAVLRLFNKWEDS